MTRAKDSSGLQVWLVLLLATVGVVVAVLI
jgi:hypothetical protein